MTNKPWTLYISLLVVLTLLAACGTGPTEPDPDGLAHPSNLEATAAMWSVELSWTAASSVDGATHHVVYQRVGSGAPSEVARVDLATTSFTVTGLFEATEHTFHVTAFGGGEESSPSNSASATPLQTVSFDEGTHIAFSWKEGHYLMVPAHEALDLGQALTLEARIYLSETHGCFNLFGTGSQTGYGLAVCDGVLRSFTAGSATVFDGGDVPYYEWVHVAMTTDGVTRTHFVDGEAVGSALMSIDSLQAAELRPQAEAANFFIGNDPELVDTSPAAMMIDEVRVWDAEREAAEIRADRNSSISSPRSGLVGAWPLDRDGRDALGRLHAVMFGTPAFGFEGQIMSDDPRIPNPIFGIFDPWRACRSQVADTLLGYKVHEFQIDRTGIYDFWLFYDYAPSVMSAGIAIYQDSFDPENHLANCIASTNVFQRVKDLTVRLEPGTYYAVLLNTGEQHMQPRYWVSVGGPY